MCINAFLVPSRIDTNPTFKRLKIDPVQAVQNQTSFRRIAPQDLVAESRWNPDGSKECGQEMALGVTYSGPFPEDLTGGTGDAITLDVGRVRDFIADPLEEPAGLLNRVAQAGGDLPGLREDGRSLPVNDVVADEITSQI